MNMLHDFYEHASVGSLTPQPISKLPSTLNAFETSNSKIILLVELPDDLRHADETRRRLNRFYKFQVVRVLLI